MWPHKANTLIEREALFEQILATGGLTGVTFLGGEPLEQEDNLQWFLEALGATELDLVLYTGYTLEEIQSMNVSSAVQAHVDILIAGRYEEALRNTSLRWRGSENQEILCLSGLYDVHDFEECNQVEIHIDEFATVTTLGYPEY